MLLFSFSILVLIVLAQGLFTVSAAPNPKRGISYAESDAQGADILQANQSQSILTWVYNWASSPPEYLADSGLEYVPMSWDLSGIDTFASKVQAQNAKYTLAFNEPDLGSQANLSPSDAASAYVQYINPIKTTNPDIRLGAPAVTNGDSGRPWLEQFFGNCTSLGGCTVDFIPLHWYGDGIGPFYDYIGAFHGEFGDYPLWITEYASTSPNIATVIDFAQQTATYLDFLDWIERYAWFAFARDDGQQPVYELLDPNGQLNDLGKAYVL